MSLFYKIGIVSLVMATNAWCSQLPQESFPQGIRDPVLSIAYVQTDTTVVAIRLSDGGSVWTYPSSGRPIAVLDERLAIQVNISAQSFRIDIVNKATGALIIRSENKPFSQTAGDRRELTTPPLISAKSVDEMLLLQWRIRRRYGGGANPPPAAIKSSAETVIAAEMDLSNGKIQTNSREVSPPQGNAGEGDDKELHVGQSAQYIRNGQWSDRPWSADSAVVSLSEGVDSKGLVLEIRSKDSNATKRIPLSQGTIAAPPYVAGDGMYLLLQNKDGRWTIYAANDGKQIGTFLAGNVTEPCVVGSRVYYRSEQTAPGQTGAGEIILVSQDLTTGKIVWTQLLGVVPRINRPKLPQ